MISAIILAAGESKRMGQPKMLLPWGNVTIIEHVISVIMNSRIEDILVITGGAREQIEKVIAKYPVQIVYNKTYSNNEMLSSLQYGLNALKPQVEAALVVLGDQPQGQERSVQMVCGAFHDAKSNIIVPSYQMRRGHPWLVARPLWNELLEMKFPQSPRDFLNIHKNEIHYITMEDQSILADLDTPDDYQRSHP